MTTLRKAMPYLLVLLAALLAFRGQQPIRTVQAQNTATPYDCSFSFTFTATGAQTGQPNSATSRPCVSWRVAYYTSGFTTVTVQFETSPDNSTWTAVPTTICTATAQPPCTTDGVNPLVGKEATSGFRAYSRYVRVNVTSVTGSGSGTVVVYGNKGASVASASSGVAGPTGATGATGPQGPAGANGVDGTNGAPGFSPNSLTSGGNVVWTSGYNFTVGAAAYTINGTAYTSALTDITLTAAHATLNRIDTIIVNASGVVAVLEGTAATTPAEPVVDPGTQLSLGFVYLPAASTQPADVVTTLVYDENTGPAAEWTASSSGATWALGSTTNPYHGTKDVEATSTGTGVYVRFQIQAGTITPVNYNNLVLYIRSKATWANNRSLTVSLLNAGVQQGIGVTLATGQFGFSSAVTAAYQQVAIPMNLFGALGLNFNQIQFTVAGSGAAIGFYLDYIQLQSGVTTSAKPNALTWASTWNATKSYAVNNVVAYSGTSWVCVISNTNSAPTPANTNWAQVGISLSSTDTLTNKTLDTPSLGNTPVTMSYLVGTAGVTAAKLTEQDGSSPAAAKTAVVSSNSVIGVALTTQTSGQTVQIALTGKTSCVSDTAVVTNNLVGVSTSVAGDCTDLGTSDHSLVMNNIQIMGRWLETGAAGTRTMRLFGAGNFGGAIPTVIGGGASTAFYLDDTSIVPAGAGPQNAYPIVTLSPVPITTAVQTDNIACTLATTPCLMEAFLNNTALNTTTIPGGTWAFNFYNFVNSTAGGRVSSMIHRVNRVRPYAANITVTDTPSTTSRTATAASGTPFSVANIGAGPWTTPSTAPFLQTPNGMFLITSRTSDTVVIITTLSTYTAEAPATSYAVWTSLFTANSEIITATAAGTLQTTNSVQGDFTIAATDKIGYFPLASVNNTTTVSFTHNGTSTYSFFTTPFTQLSIAQGATLAVAGAFAATNTYTATTNSTFPAGTKTLMATDTVIADAQLPTKYKTITCQPGLGDGLNAMAAGTYLETTCLNEFGATWTITGVKCFTDNNGTSTMNVTNGAASSLLTGAITCSNAFAAGTQSGTTTIAAGDYLKFSFVADGTSKQTTWVVTGTR